MNVVYLRNKVPLRLTANKAREDVTGSIQMCTIVGVLNFKVYNASVRYLLGFQQQYLGMLPCMSQYVTLDCDVTSKDQVMWCSCLTSLSLRVYKGLRNDAWGSC